MSWTYAHKFKCLACSLHFVVYSWSGDWKMGGEHEGVHCPECGNTTSFIRWAPEEMEEFIFQLVPGSAGYMAHSDA